MQYNQFLDVMIIGSTPKESPSEGAAAQTVSDTTTVLFDADSEGHLSNLKMVRISPSIARDFWTLYAVATCPPHKPFKGLKPPIEQLKIDNAPLPMEQTQEELTNRLALQHAIPRKREAQTIYFALIPPSW